MLFIPNSTTAHIKVLCCDGSDDGPHRSVFINLHGIKRLAEHWWLIYIQHADFDCSGILKWPSRVKAVVKVQVGGLYFKCICLLCFKI